MFKVGDKVVRKKEHRNMNWKNWKWGDSIVTIQDIDYQILYFKESFSGWLASNFELVQSVDDELRIGDEVYIKSNDNFPKIIIGEDGDNWVIKVKLSDKNVYYSRAKNVCFKKPQIEEWWVPVFKEGKIPFQMGRNHFSSKDECDKFWRDTITYIGSVRVDKNAKKFTAIDT